MNEGSQKVREQYFQLSLNSLPVLYKFSQIIVWNVIFDVVAKGIERLLRPILLIDPQGHCTINFPLDINIFPFFS